MTIKWRLILLVSLCIVCLLPIGNSLAADNWYVYLYNGMNQELLRVNFFDGSTESFDLGLDDDIYVFGWTMGVSQDGQLVAFCSNTPSENGLGMNTVVVVRDIVAETNLTEVNLNQTVGCHLGKNAFNADSSLLTIGVVNYFPTTVDDTDNGKPIWQLLVVNTANGELVNELNANMPLITQLGFSATEPIMPEVYNMTNDEIIFAMTPYGVGGIAYSDVYRWDLATNTLELLFGGPRSNTTLTDTLPATGETVWLDYDPSLPAIEMPAADPFNRFNVVKMLDQSGTERIIYYCADVVLGMPRFIDGGERLALMIHTPIEANMPFDSRWITLDRQGDVSELETDTPYVELVNAPDGCITFERFINDTAGTSDFSLSYHNAANDDIRMLWTDEEEGWEYLWSSPVTLGSELIPFPSFE